VPAFFDTVGIPLLTGRDFTWDDNSRGRRVTVISQSLAVRLFGSASPLGRRLRIGLDAGLQDLEVVGVVADARPTWLR
jgi:hypothetical protein